VLARRTRSRPPKAVREERGLGPMGDTPWVEASEFTGVCNARGESGLVEGQVAASSRGVHEGRVGRAATPFGGCLRPWVRGRSTPLARGPLPAPRSEKLNHPRRCRTWRTRSRKGSRRHRPGQEPPPSSPAPPS